MAIFSDYKKEILSIVFGALIGGIITLFIGLYTLDESFQLTYKKELKSTLKKDINALKNVEKDLDKNLSILLSQKIIPDIKFEKILEHQDKFKNSPFYFLYPYLKDYQITIKYNMPTDTLFNKAWTPYRESSEIDFGVCQDLNDLYSKMEKVNFSLEEIGHIIGYSPIGISPTSAIEIQRLIKIIETEVNDIKKDKILSIKNKVGNEIKRLEVKYYEKK